MLVVSIRSNLLIFFFQSDEVRTAIINKDEFEIIAQVILYLNSLTLVVRVGRLWSIKWLNIF